MVLRDYMQPEEFQQLVAETGIQVRKYKVRGTIPGVDSTVRHTFFGAPSSEQVVSSQAVENARANLKNHARNLRADQIAAQRTGNPDAEGTEELTKEELENIDVADNDVNLDGIYAFEATADAAGYRRLRKDPRIFHIDVTATWAYKQVKDQITWEGFFDKVFNLTGFNTFWDMERVGLEKFK